MDSRHSETRVDLLLLQVKQGSNQWQQYTISNLKITALLRNAGYIFGLESIYKHTLMTFSIKRNTFCGYETQAGQKYLFLNDG